MIGDDDDEGRDPRVRRTLQLGWIGKLIAGAARKDKLGSFWGLGPLATTTTVPPSTPTPAAATTPPPPSTTSTSALPLWWEERSLAGTTPAPPLWWEEPQPRAAHVGLGSSPSSAGAGFRGAGLSHAFQSILLSTLILGMTSAFTVYDCDDHHTTYATIDLTEPEPCIDPTRTYQPPVNVTVQLLQMDSHASVTAYQCKVVIDKYVSRCGFDSISYGTIASVVGKVHEVTNDDCRIMARDRVFVYKGRTFKVDYNTPFESRYFTQGYLDDAHKCFSQSTCVSGGKSYENCVEETRLRIQLRAQKGQVDPTTSTLKVFGVRAPFQDLTFKDIEIGTVVWRAQKLTCKETVNELYLGVAQLHRLGPHGHRQGQKGDLLLINNAKTKQYAGIILRQEKKVCGQSGWATQINGLSVILVGGGIQPLTNATFKRHVDMASTAIQTQLSFLHANKGLNDNARIRAVWRQMCKLNRHILHNKLTALASGTESLALLDQYAIGHQVLRAGAMVYVAKCSPVVATLRTTPNCSQEIPIMVNRTIQHANLTSTWEIQHVFADALTFVIKPFAEIIPCDQITPIRYKIEGKWFCSSPHPSECKSPVQMQLDAEMDSETRDFDFTRGMGENIYSPEQEAEHRHFEWMSMSREAVLTSITHTAVQTGSEGSMGLTLNQPTLEVLRDYVLGSFTWAWRAFKNCWEVVMIILTVYFISRIIIEGITRMVNIGRHYGCSPWLLCGLFTCCYNVVLGPKEMADHAARNIADQGHQRFMSATEQDAHLREALLDEESGLAGTEGEERPQSSWAIARWWRRHKLDPCAVVNSQARVEALLIAYDNYRYRPASLHDLNFQQWRTLQIQQSHHRMTQLREAGAAGGSNTPKDATYPNLAGASSTTSAHPPGYESAASAPQNSYSSYPSF